MSDLSPLSAPKRTSAVRAKFMGARPSEASTSLSPDRSPRVAQGDRLPGGMRAMLRQVA
jgi:hypothetical protein